jgi:hypothetical protein
MRRLGRQGILSFTRNRIKISARQSLADCCHGSFDERRGAQAHLSSLIVAQELESSFGAEHGTAQVHQDENAILTINRLDGVLHSERVCADGIVRIVGAARGG